MKLRNVKVRVKSQDDSIKFQELVFKSGGEWGDGGANVKRTNKPFLFVNNDGKITYQESKAEPFFDAHRYTDFTLKLNKIEALRARVTSNDV